MGEEARVHVNAVLCVVPRQPAATPPPRLHHHAAAGPYPVLHTESSTLLRAVSSASRFSFLRCSSAKVRWAAPPLVARAVVGPEGTVGAWRLFILSGRPIAVGSRRW